MRRNQQGSHPVGVRSSLDNLEMSFESRFEWQVQFDSSDGENDECEHSLGTYVRITVRAGLCLWASLQKKGKL